MDAAVLCELQNRRRRQLILLNEVLDLSTQMLQGMERNDQVSVKILLSMRQDPILKLQEIENGIRSYLLLLPEEDAIRAHELLRGAPSEESGEEALCAQTAQFRRLLENAIKLDKRLSLGLSGKSSFYNNFRE